MGKYILKMQTKYLPNTTKLNILKERLMSRKHAEEKSHINVRK